jgi:kinetochore protein NDC80
MIVQSNLNHFSSFLSLDGLNGNALLCVPSSKFSLHDLIKTRDGYVTDLEQFHDLINQMEEHVAKLTQQKTDLSEELEETKTNLTKAATRVKELNDRLANQDLSLEDVQKMENERKGVEEAIDRAVTLRDQRRSALWEIESELEKLWSDLESFASDYNSNLGVINVLDVVAIKGILMKATVNKDVAQDPNPTKLLAVDLPGLVHPTLASCKEEYTKLLSESKWRYQEALDQLAISEEEFTEALEKLRIIESKMDKCEEVMEAEREAQEAKLAVRAREAESMEAKVASLRDPVALEEQMAQFERQCAELEALRQQHEEINIARKKSVCEEIEYACEQMKEYDEYCLAKIREVRHYREEKQATYGKLRMPGTK